MWMDSVYFVEKILVTLKMLYQNEQDLGNEMSTFAFVMFCLIELRLSGGAKFGSSLSLEEFSNSLLAEDELDGGFFIASIKV